LTIFSVFLLVLQVHEHSDSIWFKNYTAQQQFMAEVNSLHMMLNLPVYEEYFSQ